MFQRETKLLELIGNILTEDDGGAPESEGNSEIPAESRGGGRHVADIVEELNQSLSQADRHFQKSVVFSVWQEYHYRWSQLKEENSLLIRVSGYFDPVSLTERVERQFALDASAIVSLGVFLTFLGFVLGLGGIANTDIEKMKYGIGQLLGGVRSGFITSIIGIFSSGLWMVKYRIRLNKFEHKARHVCALLSNALDPDEEEIVRQRMERMLRSNLGELRTVLADAMEQAMRPSVERIERQTEILQQHLELQRGQSREIADRMVEGVAAGTGERLSQLASVVASTREILQQLTDVVQTIILRHSQVQSEWDQVVTRMSEFTQQLDRLNQEVTGLMAAAQELGRQIGHHEERAEQLLAAQHRWLPEFQSTLMGHGQFLAQAGQQFVEAGALVNQRLQTMSEHWSRVQETFTRTTEALDSTMQKFFEQVDGGLSRTYTHFDNTLKDAMQNLGGAVQATKEMNEALANRVQDFGEALEQLAGTIQQLPARLVTAPAVVPEG
ncbi:MAG: hypothetical protein K6T30_02070 [Alicyclobacillus sp.]|nr:hypothetical protein [Alicyclobacillus sp.]